MIEQSVPIERRERPRTPCEPPLRASFNSTDGSIHAHVEDISLSGAKLRIVNADRHIPFLVQGEIDYTFQTGDGTLQCRARTAWVQRAGVDFMVGIEFTGLPASVENPLRIIIGNLRTAPQAM